MFLCSVNSKLDPKSTAFAFFYSFFAVQGQDDVFGETDNLLPSPSEFSDKVLQLSDGNDDGIISEAGISNLHDF